MQGKEQWTGPVRLSYRVQEGGCIGWVWGAGLVGACCFGVQGDMADMASVLFELCSELLDAAKYSFTLKSQNRLSWWVFCEILRQENVGEWKLPGSIQEETFDHGSFICWR